MTLGDTNTNGDAAQSADVGDDDNAAAQQSPLRRAQSRLLRTWRGALDVVLPPLCLGCQTRLSDHDALCSECWRAIDFIRPPLCDRLGIPMPYDIGGPMISAAAAAHPPVFDHARAVGRYDGLLRQLIHDFKFRDSHNARRLFGRWLCQADPQMVSEADAIVPVPLARLRLLARRFNQAQMLAAEISHIARKPLLPLALKRTRATPHQIGLSRPQRERNVAGAFAVSPGAVPQIAGKSILLVDDVMTTGATASAAAKALKAAGAGRVDVLVLAMVTDTLA
ncbi:MAG: ComF family protein [Hyphomicrobium sp.]|nr:ComF family protein [Hyphomicrobium sp.]